MKKFLILPFFIILLACHSMKNSSENRKANSDLVHVLYSSSYQGRDTESNVIITNQDDLKTLYQSIGNQEIPKIDFAKNQVVALFLGTRNTGGYRISIDRVEEEAEKLILYKKEETPKGGAVTMALTNPFIVAEICSKKEIIFR